MRRVVDVDPFCYCPEREKFAEELPVVGPDEYFVFFLDYEFVAL
jgi:hypothetical protein